MGIFDNKNFNSEVFGKYLETVPRVKQNALLRAGVIRNRGELASMLSDQTGGNVISLPMSGRIGGASLNYDGSTDITATNLDTYLQTMIVTGRAKAWKERDFSYDITGHDFMATIANQVGEYWDDVDQTTILKILDGVFGVETGNFNTAHTLDITSNTGAAASVDATTLNTAVQKFAGANKNIFSAVIMHSTVATNLENANLLTYAQYNDADGMKRDTTLATWNGRTVLIDDDVPTGTASDKTYYTTYVLGADAFDYCDCGARTPIEVYRDPLKNGGEEQLITRQRKLYAPRGFSFVQSSSPVVSPTDTQLATKTYWDIVKATDGTTLYPLNAIPIGRILSLG